MEDYFICQPRISKSNIGAVLYSSQGEGHKKQWQLQMKARKTVERGFVEGSLANFSLSLLFDLD